MPQKRPIFLFAFANDAEGSLRLGEEQNVCWNELGKIHREEKIEYQNMGFATLEQIYQRFNEYNDQIYFFHYGGHSNSEVIQLHGPAGSAENLSIKIGQQENLKLVFLNGCKNYGQVNALFDQGVPAIIATTANIEDQRAIVLARQFYQALAGGSSIRKAFESAKTYIFDAHSKLKHTYRTLGFDEEDNSEFSWGLYTQDDSTLDWHIGMIEQDDRLETLSRLREASRRRYNAFTGKGGRYQYLRIDGALLAGIEDTHEDEARKLIQTRVGEDKTPLENSLETLWPAECAHALLVGAGGMGKTVSLIQLWEHYLNNKKVNWPAPVFIPLNEFNNRPQEGFIRNYIQEHYGKEVLDGLLREALLIDDTRCPHLILLLDGFNEVTASSNLLILEINELKAKDKYPGVQLVLSSRVDMRQVYQWQLFHLLELRSLSDAQIEGYLKKPLPADTRLLELLRNPMMLSIYAAQTELPQRYRDKGLLKEAVTSTGEILFNVEQLQRIKIEEHHPANLSEQAFQRFTLEHLLPAIAWQMQQAELFFLEKRVRQEGQLGMEEALQQAIRGGLSDAFFDTFGYFSQHLEEERFEERPRKLFHAIIDELFCQELALLVAEDGNFRFLHQNFRDYFAARYVQNQIQIALNQDKLPELLKEAPLDFYVRQILGELEGEHLNKPRFQFTALHWSTSHYTDTILSRTLEKCRGIFNEEGMGYIVWNILTIHREKHGRFSGADLRNLDLRKFALNNLQLSNACLSGSLITPKTLFAQGHSSSILNLSYSPDGRYIVTGSADNKVKIWDAKTGQCIFTLEEFSSSIKNLTYSPDGRCIFIASENVPVKVWDIKTRSVLATLEEENKSSVSSMAYCPNGDYLVTGSAGSMAKVWDIKTGTVFYILEGHASAVNSVAYSPDGKHIVTGSADSMAKVWDTKTGAVLHTLEGHASAVNSVVCSPDGKHIVTGSTDSMAKIWDTKTGTVLHTLEGHASAVNSVACSPDGKHIVTGSTDSMAKIWDTKTGSILYTQLLH